MKFNWNKKYATISVYALLVILAGILAHTLIQNFKGFSEYTSYLMNLAQPFIYGFVIAYILSPLLNRFDRQFLPWISRNKIKPKPRRMVAILLTYLVAWACLSIFFSIVFPEIGNSVAGIASKFPDYIKVAEEWIAQILAAVNSWGGGDAGTASISQTILDSFDAWLAKLLELLKNSLPVLINTTQQLAGGVLNVILGIIISIYLLANKELFFAQIKKAMFAFLPATAVDRSVYIVHKAHITFGGFINGKLLDSLIIGILCFIGMSIFKMPNAMLISVIVGVTNVIPYFGPFIGAVPSALIILLTDPRKTIWFLIFILVLQQFDGNILGPKILGETTGLSAFWVIFAIVVFSSLLGVLGMFIGVPLFAVIYTLICEYIDDRLARKEMSTMTKDYASEKNKIEF